MKITYIITISPVIEVKYLNYLFHSLNMQTSAEFDVVLFNQTLYTEKEVLLRTRIKPMFKYSFFSVSPKNFFGDYPLWDLYGFHEYLLENDLVSDYFMSLHMEEFLDASYTKNILRVLSKNRFDILLGNLHSSTLQYEEITTLLGTTDTSSYEEELKTICSHRIQKWSLSERKWFLTRRPFTNLKKSMMLGCRKSLKHTIQGYTYLKRYMFEDVYAMSTKFAKESEWFCSEHSLVFEDIHINWRLAPLVQKLTRFPVYINSSKIYHIKHRKYYYQIENKEFADGILVIDTDNPVIHTLQRAIELYRNSELNAAEALRYSRKQGTVKYNVNFHNYNERKKDLK